MEALAAVTLRSAAVRAQRRPLVRRSTKAAAVRMFNPRFEDDFAAGKDYDPDRCGARPSGSKGWGINWTNIRVEGPRFEDDFAAGRDDDPDTRAAYGVVC